MLIAQPSIEVLPKLENVCGECKRTVMMRNFAIIVASALYQALP